MEVSLEEGFAEACRALGESMVRERLLARRCADMEAQNAALVAQVLAGDNGAEESS